MGEAFSNELAAAQVERFALLAEELGEAVQIIGKILRHGANSYHPNDADEVPNKELLVKELGDIQFAVELLCATHDIDEALIEWYRVEKIKKVEQYLHHQEYAMKLYRRRWPYSAPKAESEPSSERREG